MSQEISLREIWNIITSRKKAVVIITVFCMIFSLLLTKFYLDPIYKSSALIMINSSSEEKEQFPIKDLTPLIEQIYSTYTLNKIGGYLELNQIEMSNLRKNITLEYVKNTNLIKIMTKAKTAKTSADLANIIANEIASNIEISKRMDLIVDYNRKLMDAQDRVNISNKEIDQATRTLVDTPEKLITNRSLSTDAYLQSVVTDVTRLTAKEAGPLQMTNEEINPVYTQLKTKLAEATIALAKNQADVNNNSTRIKELQDEIANIEKNKLEATAEKLITNINRFKAAVITPTIEPAQASGPNMKLNIIMGFFLGLIMGIAYSMVSYMSKNKSIYTKNIQA